MDPRTPQREIDNMLGASLVLSLVVESLVRHSPRAAAIIDSALRDAKASADMAVSRPLSDATLAGIDKEVTRWTRIRADLR
jgi:hypothetical protein